MLQNEPLLDRRFFEWLAEAHEAEDVIESISTVTNGSTLRPDVLDRLLSYTRLHLTISLNANDPASYRAIHGVDLWSRISDVLTSWTGPRHRVRLSFVLDRASMNATLPLPEIWRAQGYKTRLVPRMSRAGSVPLDPERRLALDDFGHCHYPVDTLNVLADGSVILCCNNWQHKQTFGNLHDSSIREIWNSPGLAQIRKMSIKGRIRSASVVCRDCDYPMRSSVRMELEALCDPELRSADGQPFTIVPHASKLQMGPDNSIVPVVVYGIDSAKCLVMCAASVHEIAHGPDSKEALFLIRIAAAGSFSFGSMSPVWCPARVGITSLLKDQNPPVALLGIELDSRADAAQLLPWYESDWTHPTVR